MGKKIKRIIEYIFNDKELALNYIEEVFGFPREDLMQKPHDYPKGITRYQLVLSKAVELVRNPTLS